MQRITPLFLRSTPHEDRVMSFFVIANGALVLFCMAFLISRYQASGQPWILILTAIVAGYFLADFGSGLVHWALDTWFTEQQFGRLVAIAREHHTHPQHILGYRFLDHASLGSIPSATLLWPVALLNAAAPVTGLSYAFMIVVFILALCFLFGTSLHNFGHRRAKTPILRLAQRSWLFITPEHHAVHHGGDQTTRYCTVNGWANPLCDRLGVWRGLEAVVSRLTGAPPRENDRRWQAHFRSTGQTLWVPQRSPTRN